MDGADTVYDGFISYSHAADDLLAPRLQAGLQRFAKPWWKRRAVWIFRDEASLSANPHLWSSITEAMDGSDWFVLLLSSDAAESEWVNREIEYWLEHKDPDRILPVVTDGEFSWSEGNVVGDTVPPALRGAFADEPRWVDLRFARTQEQLDLNNASFRAAIADIASPIRGIPKDELESEEVRQHRRTVRTAWAAAIALLALVVVAGAAAVYANGQRLAANENAAEADANAAEADAQRDVAEQQTDRAEELAFDARSDALAASAIAQLDIDPELALLLATQALEREIQQSAVSATHQALQRHRAIFEVSTPPPDTLVIRAAAGGLSPDGDLLVMAGLDQDLEVWEVGGTEPLWTAPPPAGELVYAARFSTDGDTVVALLGPAGHIDPQRDAGATSTFVLFDSLTGEELNTRIVTTCPVSLDPSSLAEYVDLARPIPWAGAEFRCEDFQVPVGFVDLSKASGTTEVTKILAGAGNEYAIFGVPTSTSDGRYLAVGAGGPGQVIDVATGEVVFAYDRGISTLSSDGAMILARGHDAGQPLELWSLVDNELLWSFPRVFTRAWFGADESLVYGTSTDGATYVLDASTGAQLLRLTGQDGIPIGATMATDGSRLATFADDFTARVWNVRTTLSEGATFSVHAQDREHMAASADLAGGIAAVWGGIPAEEEMLWETSIIDLETGEAVRTIVGGAPALSPDGSRLAYRSIEVVEVTPEKLKLPAEAGTHPRVGPVHIIDVATGKLLVEIDVPCEQFQMPHEAVPAVECDLASGGFEWDLEFSSDGTLLAMADSYDEVALMWDTTTGDEAGRDISEGANVRAIAFTPDGTQVAVLFAGGITQRLRVYGTESFAVQASTLLRRGVTFAEMVFLPDGSLLIGADNTGQLTLFDAETWNLLEPIAAHQGSALDVAVNPSGTLIASGGEDAFVRVWNASDRSLVTEISFEVDAIGNVEFIDDTTLFVMPGFGSEAIVITLDPDELLDIARSRLIRTFTAEECARFGIEDCPTLDEIKSG